MVTNHLHTTWVEISRRAYLHNIHAFRKIVGPAVELTAVIKANAYGHGWQEIAALARETGIRSFAVHSLDEALQLRQAGFQEDILVMSHPPLARVDAVVAHNFRQVVYTIPMAKAIAAAATDAQRPVRIHLKIETGTHRQGIPLEDLPHFLNSLLPLNGLIVEGAYTHFANIEDTTDHTYAFLQLERFQQALNILEQHDVHPTKIHTACSAAILLFPQTHFSMVRLGISQYGLWPSRETFLSYAHTHPHNGRHLLQPVLSWKTRVLQVKTVPAGECIGYGCTYQASRPTRLAVLPVGYADGYDRRLSNQSYVLIRGQRAPVRGRVCMNLTMVDVTDIPGVHPEEEVVLLGKQEKEHITAEQLAAWIGTIPYEVVTRINWTIPRLIVE